MNILIIGNGFDLAHGLPTKYIDFLEFCKNYPLMDSVHIPDDLEKEFSGLIHDNLWIRYFQKIDKDQNLGKTWIDFENEISKIINYFENNEYTVNYSKYRKSQIDFVLSSNNKNINDLILLIGEKNQGMSGKGVYYKVRIKDIYDKNTFTKYLFDQLRNFSRAFEIYCLGVNNISIGTNAENFKEDIIIDDSKGFSHILSFNYTNTFKRLYGTQDTKYCYIHGEAQEDKGKTNLILGVIDNLPKGKESQNLLWVKFKKYFQRIIYKTGAEYKKWFCDTNDETRYVHIIGHSLGTSDQETFYEILNMPHTKFYIYYYDEDDFVEKVQNVIRILDFKKENGRDKLIQRVYGDNWSIKFVYQYDEQEGLFKLP